MNPHRGEAALELFGERWTVRPSFEALVAAEDELGPLFELIDRAAAGKLKLCELAALIWHCMAKRPEGLTRAAFGEALIGLGLARLTPVLRAIVAQALNGR